MTNAVADLSAASPAEVESSLLNPDVSMVVLTWVTFLVLSVVLYKFAWNPILKALDAREDLLRRSIAEADRIKEELARIHETRQQFIREAEEKARIILRQESAQVVIDLAAKLIEKNLDTEGNRKLIHQLIVEV